MSVAVSFDMALTATIYGATKPTTLWSVILATKRIWMAGHLTMKKRLRNVSRKKVCLCPHATKRIGTLASNKGVAEWSSNQR